jgi:aryl-alcohol dehydrogenase-like predicted oxidoreductase
MKLVWVLQNRQVDSALSGTRRRAAIEENVKAFDFRLSPAVLPGIDAIMADAAGQTEPLPT